MEITDYIFKEREEVLLAGDYNAYRAHATRKLHKLRTKLGQATPKGRKYTPKPAVTAENVGSNISYVFLLMIAWYILTSLCGQIRAPFASRIRASLGSSHAREIDTLRRSISQGHLWCCQTPYHLTTAQGDRLCATSGGVAPRAVGHRRHRH